MPHTFRVSSFVVLALATSACGASSGSDPSLRTRSEAVIDGGTVTTEGDAQVHPTPHVPDPSLADAGADPCPAGDAPVRVVSQSLEGALLTLELEFGGGCEDHEFSVGYGGAATASLPPHIPLELNHYANGDSCDALLVRDVVIDLSTLPGEEPPVRIDLVDPEGKGLLGAQSVLFEGAESPTERPEGTLTVRRECSHFVPY